MDREKKTFDHKVKSCSKNFKINYINTFKKVIPFKILDFNAIYD